MYVGILEQSLEVHTMKIKHFKSFVLFGISLLVIGTIGTALTVPKVIKKTQLAISKTIPADNIKSVKLNGKTIGVSLEESPDKDIHVSINGSTPVADKFDIQTKQTGDKLDISFKTADQPSPNFVFFLNQEYQYVTLALPKSIENADIQTNLGEITSQQFTGKNLNVQTNAGQITLNNLIVDKLTAKLNGGDIHLYKSEIKESTISADVGDITIQQLIGNKTKFSTIGGDINLDQINTSSMKASTNAGDIELNNKSIDQNIDFQTKFGEIDVQTEKQPNNATITADVKLGEVQLFDQTTSTKTFGKGEHAIHLRASSGEVSVGTDYSANEEEDYDD